MLVAQRPHGRHLAGAWEFPGGKIEAGETAHAALRRELREELGVDIGAIEALIGVPWQYPKKSIFLNVYRVLDYAGVACGREGQVLDWRYAEDLGALQMPPPDRPVVSALRLPPFYAITPEPGDDDAAFLACIDRVLATGIQLLQLRAKNPSRDRLHRLAREVLARARAAGARMLLNGNLNVALELGFDGVHLPAERTDAHRGRAASHDERWLAASCHDARELAHAAAIGVDFAVLGPVRETQSHRECAPLGWTRFAGLCTAAPLPVYALGGLTLGDLDAAKAAGAQGIAGISAFWRF